MRAKAASGAPASSARQPRTLPRTHFGDSISGAVENIATLGEYIHHHVKEEEEKMFPKCRKSGMELAELGAELDERRTEFMSAAGLVVEA